MKERHHKQLREESRSRPRPPAEEAGEGEDLAAADLAEGERSGRPSTKVAHTPDQAEGGREEIEDEIRRQEENRPREG